MPNELDPKNVVFSRAAAQSVRLATPVRHDFYESIKKLVDKAKEDVDLGKAKQEVVVSTPFPVGIDLHGFYTGHHFDGGFNGDTGEFYYTAVATDGKEVAVTGSKGANGAGADGVWEKVQAGHWEDTGSMRLWPATDEYKQPRERVALKFWLLERDDDSTSKRILRGLNTIGKGAIKYYAADNEGAQEIWRGLVNVTEDLLGIPGGDDTAINNWKEFRYDDNNYQVGKFMKLSGSSNTYAIVSIVPNRNPDTNDWLRKSVDNVIGVDKEIRLELDTAGAKQERLVSIYIRPRLPYFSSYRVALTDGKKTPAFQGNAPTIKHYTLGPGSDPIRVLISSFMGPVDIRIIATAVKADGAGSSTPYFTG